MTDLLNMGKLGDFFVIHRKELGGYTNLDNTKGLNDLFVYRMLDKTFFSVVHTPDLDKHYGINNLVCSMTPVVYNSNYFALLLNSKHVQVSIERAFKEKKRISIPSFISGIYLPVVEREYQEAIGFLEVICQFLEMNTTEKVYTIEYSALKLSLFKELVVAIADEVYQTKLIKLFQLSFIHPWLNLYNSNPVENYVEGENQTISEERLLHYIDETFARLVASRSELYSNLMRYRIVRSQKD